MDHRLHWSEDSSNRNCRYTRNRLRHDWLPGLCEAFNPQLLRSIANLAEAQRRDSEWLESLVTDEARKRFHSLDCGLRIAAEDWDVMPEALARRLVRRAILELGGGRDLNRVHLQRALEFLRSGRLGREIELPGGLRLSRESDSIRRGATLLVQLVTLAQNIAHSLQFQWLACSQIHRRGVGQSLIVSLLPPGNHDDAQARVAVAQLDCKFQSTETGQVTVDDRHFG